MSPEKKKYLKVIKCSEDSLIRGNWWSTPHILAHNKYDDNGIST